MTTPGLECLMAEIGAIRTVRTAGRVTALGAGTVEVSGLSREARLGDSVSLAGSAVGEVVAIGAECVTVLADGAAGLRLGTAVHLDGPAEIAPHDGWVGRVIDPFGRPLDGLPLFRGPDPRPIDGPPPDAARRRGLGPRMETGMEVFNTLLPIARGQRIGLFAGSGVGKSTLLARLALGLQADLAVIALIGERGRELRDFVERVLGPRGLARSVVVAATSDQSAMARRRCAAAAMAVAEHFRDRGRQVVYLADSVTRLAEAHRDVALAAGETGSLGGYPPSVAPVITRLCERAGPGTGRRGDITAVFSVLVPGSDMEEPVADILRGVLDGHVVLDRRIAERGRFPAIDVLRSVSRALPDAASAEETALITEARRRLGAYERSEMMVRAGLYAAGSDPEVDAALHAWPRLDAFVGRPASGGIPESFAELAACLAPADAGGDEPER